MKLHSVDSCSKAERSMFAANAWDRKAVVLQPGIEGGVEVTAGNMCPNICDRKNALRFHGFQSIGVVACVKSDSSLCLVDFPMHRGECLDVLVPCG